MTYRAVLGARYGGPDVLQVVEYPLRPPARREVRIKVLAAAISRPEVPVRRGEANYSGTSLGQKVIFTPGFVVIGDPSD